MTKKIEILPPSVPNFIQARQDKMSGPISIFITALTEDEAIEYGELLKDTFIKHWRAKKQQQ